MANNKTLELSIKIAGKMDKSLMAALNGSQSQISSFARSISSIGTAGLAAMGTLATATVATIASCTKEAAKFENYMADVVKYVDGLADATGKISDKVADNGKTYAQNYEAMKDAIKDLSTQIPYTQEDLTRLAAAAGQIRQVYGGLDQDRQLRQCYRFPAGHRHDRRGHGHQRRSGGQLGRQVGAIAENDPRGGHGAL